MLTISLKRCLAAKMGVYDENQMGKNVFSTLAHWFSTHIFLQQVERPTRFGQLAADASLLVVCQMLTDNLECRLLFLLIIIIFLNVSGIVFCFNRL